MQGNIMPGTCHITWETSWSGENYQSSVTSFLLALAVFSEVSGQTQLMFLYIVKERGKKVRELLIIDETSGEQYRRNCYGGTSYV